VQGCEMTRNPRPRARHLINEW